jgi:hypothetical protein
MSPHQRAMVVAVFLGGLVALCGLLYRRRARECGAYVAYLSLLLAWGFCLEMWPERFYVWTWWMVKQAVFDALKIGVALELAYRAVSAFPGARARLQVAMLAILGLSTLIITTGPVHSPGVALWEWQPKVVVATIWIFGVTALAVVYFRLPVSDWHRALVLAMTMKLFLFTVVLNVLAHLGWKARPWTNVAEGLTDVAVSWTLAYFAWRPQRQEVRIRVLRERLAAGFA